MRSLKEIKNKPTDQDISSALLMLEPSFLDSIVDTVDYCRNAWAFSFYEPDEKIGILQEKYKDAEENLDNAISRGAVVLNRLEQLASENPKESKIYQFAEEHIPLVSTYFEQLLLYKHGLIENQEEEPEVFELKLVKAGGS